MIVYTMLHCSVFQLLDRIEMGTFVRAPQLGGKS